MNGLCADAVTRLAMALRHHGLSQMELALPGGALLRLTRAGGQAGAPAPFGGGAMAPPAPIPSPQALPNAIHAATPGLFQPAEDVRPIAEGATVQAGAIVGFLRAGALLSPITAPCAGQLGRCLAQEGDLLGYGSPVFEFTPSKAAHCPIRS